MAIASWVAFRSPRPETSVSAECGCAAPTTSPMRWPTSIGCASLRESSSRTPYWHYKVVHGLAPEYLNPNTCRRSTQSPITAFCWHQSPGSAYHVSSFSGRWLADMEWPTGRRDISRIIDHISSPVQEVFLADRILSTVANMLRLSSVCCRLYGMYCG